VIIDPISNLVNAGLRNEVRSMLIRLIDYMKMELITAMFTSLTHAGQPLEGTSEQISSLVDTWILLRDIELNGERNRGLYILKSRGMAHSNQIREFLLTDHGIELMDAYLGLSGVLTGSARAAQEIRDREAALAHQQETDRRRRELETARKKLAAELNTLQAEMESLNSEIQSLDTDERLQDQFNSEGQHEIARLRKANP
jgi:circadian clock protein KaiC